MHTRCLSLPNCQTLSYPIVRSLLTLIFLVLILPVCAQPSADSLKSWLRESKWHQHRNPEHAKELAQRTYAAAIRLENHDLMLHASFRLGMIYLHARRMSEAKQRFTAGLSEAKSRNNHLRVSQYYAGLNLLYRTQEKRDSALQYSLEAIDYLDHAGRDSLKIKHLNDAGETLRSLMISGDEMWKQEKILSFFQEAEEIARTLPESPPELARTYNRITAFYASSNKADMLKKAEAYAQKAVHLCQELLATYPEHLLLLDVYANTLNERAQINMRKEDYTKALHFAKEGLKLRQQIGDATYILESHYMIGRVLTEMGRYEAANAAFFAALQLAQSTGHKKEINRRIAANYDTLQDWERSARHWKATYKYEVENKKEVEIQIAQDLGAQYQAEKKEQEILLAHARNKQQRLQNTLLLGGLSILILFLGLLARNYYRRQRQNQKLKAANEKLLRLDNFKKQMTGMIVHDLKNPLNTILGHTHRKDFLEEHTIQAIHQSGNQLLTLVTNMLDVQKFEEAGISIRETDFTAHNLFTEAREQVDFLLKQKNLQLKSEIPEGLGVRGDWALSVRILVNLLTNAIKYSPQNATIGVSAAVDEGWLNWRIQDEGIGIPPKQQKYIFNRFGQINPSKSGYVGSTGLGLAFCKLAVEAHGGKIQVESEVGKGTVFQFDLPEAQLSEKVIRDAEEGTHEYTLSEEERQHLQTYLSHLRAHQVYEVSVIDRILKEIQLDGKHPGLQHWINAVEQAVFSCNEERYESLLKEAEAVPVNARK